MSPPHSPPTPGDSSLPSGEPLLTEEDAGDGVMIVRCRARFLVDPGVIAAFRDGLNDLAGRIEPGSGVVVSLSGIQHLASSALLALILFRRKVRGDRQGEVVTCGAVPWVAESFRLIAGFSWNPYPNEAAALDALRRALRSRPPGEPPVADAP